MDDIDALRRQAHAAVLNGLRSGQSLAQIEAAVGHSRVRGRYSPDLAMLELVIAALDAAGVSREQPVPTADWREQYLPELTLRNRPREVERLVYALQTATAFRTGLRPDILEDTYSWHDVELWPYAGRAAVMTIRALAAAKDLSKFCDRVQEAIRSINA